MEHKGPQCSHKPITHVDLSSIGQTGSAPPNYPDDTIEGVPVLFKTEFLDDENATGLRCFLENDLKQVSGKVCTKIGTEGEACGFVLDKKNNEWIWFLKLENDGSVEQVPIPEGFVLGRTHKLKPWRRWRCEGKEFDEYTIVTKL